MIYAEYDRVSSAIAEAKDALEEITKLRKEYYEQEKLVDILKSDLNSL